MILFSFVIIHYNNFEYLRRCVISLESFNDLKPEEYEMILVDNGSTDEGVVWARRECRDLKVVRMERNAGFARAANAGIRAAQGRLIAIVNNDVEFMRGTSMRRLIEVFEKTPRTGLVCPQLLNADMTYQASYFFFPTLVTELFNKSLLRRTRWGARPTKPEEVPAAVGAFIVLSAEALRDVHGGFDEDYFFFLEETDLCYRLHALGWKIMFTPLCTIIHHQGKTANRRPIRARIEYYTSRYLYFRKNRPWLSRVLLRAGLVLKLAVNAAAHAVACLLTLGLVRRVRDKFFMYAVLLGWHLIGCPARMGLRGL